jgi:hypothetical protein
MDGPGWIAGYVITKKGPDEQSGSIKTSLPVNENCSSLSFDREITMKTSQPDTQLIHEVFEKAIRR